MDRAPGFGPGGCGFDSCQTRTKKFSEIFQCKHQGKHLLIMNWHVYIVKCSDESLYTGITTDINRRVLEHNTSNRGAKSLRGKRPVSLVYSELYTNQSEARKREAAIKKWKKEYKLKLIAKLTK